MTTYRTFETHVDLSQNIRYWEGEGETYTVKSRGDLFKALRTSFGRCVSKMYSETKQQDCIEVGWVFAQRIVNDEHVWQGGKPYRYTREVWVEAREVPEEEMN